MASLRETQEILGSNVRLVRHGRGLSQEEFAELVGIAKVSIATIEAGRSNLRLETLVKLADAVGIEPCELLLFHGDDWEI